MNRHDRLVPKKRIGRPTIPGKLGEKSTISTRVTAELKDRLITEANQNDRSLSQEAELRLEQSFLEDRIEARLIEILSRLPPSLDR